MTETPWSDCKVAFPINDDKKLWNQFLGRKLKLPHGWTLSETDPSGSRTVAVFRIEGRPLLADGEAVKKLMETF